MPTIRYRSTPVTYVTTYAYTTSPTGGPTGTFGSTTVTDPNGLVSTYYWDPQRRVIQVKDANGNKQSNSYDSTTGEIGTYTDNVSNISSTVSYADRMVSSVTEPATGTNTPASSGVDNRSDTDPGSS